MIPLYILGLLLRFGPQHGYQIKKLVEEQLADFTQIKLPTIYYHLEKLAAAGLLVGETGQEGARPEKQVYRVSEKGAAEFGTLLRGELAMRYRPTFDADALFYFSDHLSGRELLDGLCGHLETLRQSLARIEEHRAQTMPFMPEEMQPWAGVIFEHHAAHYRAEIAWAEQTTKTIQEEMNHDRLQSD